MDTHLTCSLSWGLATSGQLGNGVSSGDFNTPQQVTGLLSGVVSVSCGDSFTCVLKADTTASCFGSNTNGYLGTGDTANYNTPQPFASGLSGIEEIATSSYTTCVAVAPFDVRCVGSDDWGELGNGAPNSESYELVNVLFESGSPTASPTSSPTSRDHV
jgi:alpha-tubulin suppressor-like RCC1 family protein